MAKMYFKIEQKDSKRSDHVADDVMSLLNRDPFVHNNRNGSVYNYIRSSRRQVPREIQPYIKDFPAWISDILESQRDAQNSD